MKSQVRSWQVGMLLATSVLVGACGQPTKFDPAAFNDRSSIEKNAGNYWKREGFWGGVPKDVKKVAITQFNVDYVVENVSKSGANTLSVLGVMEMGGMGHRQRQFPDDFKRQFPTQLYNAFVDALKAEGIEVVAMGDLQKQAAFSEFKTGEAGKSSSASGRDLLGHADNSTQVKMQTFPAEGLPLIDDGWFNAGNNFKAEAKLVGDSGAQAGMRVRIRVALDDDGHAILDKGSGVHVIYAPEKQNWSGTQEWVFKQRGELTGSGAMRDDVAVADKKDFEVFKGDIYKVDAPKFQASIMKMYPAYARMAVVRLRG